MVVAMVGAVRLARSNGRRHEELLERHRAVEASLSAEATLTATARTSAYAALVVFTDVFSRVRGADLRELAETGGAVPTGGPHVALPSARPAAAAALLSLAGGAAAGSAAGAVTFSAVGALATASTGTAISGLSGAAASSATLAWLGGGSLAAGGGGVAAGTAVLTAVVAAPVAASVVVVGQWQGRRLRRAQRDAADRLTEGEDELTREEGAAAARVRASAQARAVLDGLEATLRRLLPAFERAVETSEDLGTWPEDQRRLAGRLVAVATHLAEVMASRDGARTQTDTDTDTVHGAEDTVPTGAAGTEAEVTR